MEKLRGNPTLGLFGATLGFFFGFAAVALFGSTANKFKDLMQLTPVMLGFLVAIPNLSGSILRIPFAAWVDINGGRKPFLTLMILSLVGMLGLTVLIWQLYPDKLDRSLYPLLLLLGILCGCGIATFSVGTGQVSYWFPQKRQGSALGTYAGIGNLAPGIFSFLLPVALTSLGLARSYLVWLVFLAVGTVLYYFLGRNSFYFQLLAQGYSRDQSRELARQRGQELFPAGSMLDSLRISSQVWKTWALVAIYFTTFGGFLALTAWLPTYWTAFFSTTTVTAGVLTGLYSIMTSLIRVAGGSISDRLGGENTVVLSLLVMFVGAVLFGLSHSFALSVAAEVIMGLGMGVSNAAVFKLVPQNVPQAVGGASGWIGGLGAFGGFVIPPVLGSIVNAVGKAGYGDGFLTIALLAFVSISMGFALRQARKKEVESRAYEVEKVKVV
ncbi:MAG: MFS transporter [Omnitrophica WOR_2 bacterium]